MIVKEYKNLSKEERGAFVRFLKDARAETSQPAHENMWDDNWIIANHTLPYLLEFTDRFNRNGTFHVVFDNDEVIACGGIYTSEFCSKLAIAGTRTWVSAPYRNKSVPREILLPEQKKWAIDNGYGAIAVCFNTYNKNIINTWKRQRLGERRGPRMPHHLFFNGIEEVPYMVTIQYTKQWVIYEKLDQSFEFDWSSIR